MSLCLTGIFATLFSSVLTMYAFYGFFQTQVKAELRVQGQVLAHSVDYTREDVAYLSMLAEQIKEDMRMTIIGKDGTVVYDSLSNAALMENHLDRPEIQSALSYGSGEAVRQSETMGKNTYYYAIRLGDGRVLRISKQNDSIASLYWSILPLILSIVLILLLGCIAVASFLTRILIRPLEAAADHIDPDMQEKGGKDYGLYGELEPFFHKIREQNSAISEYIRTLKRERDSIEAITRSMREGLVIIDGQKNVLSVNRSAAQLLGAKNSALSGHSLISLSRNLELNRAAEKALADGGSTDFTVRFDEHISRVFVSPVYTESRITGAIIFIMDVTEQTKAELVRRDFSANVSHELKTPLTSINGFAEMIEGGMAKNPADVRKFASLIHREAQRLISLIDDIMRLSRIEETDPQSTFEQVNLHAQAAEALSSLSHIAADKYVKIELAGTDAVLSANRRMMDELIFNLADNAIKYNKPGGTVTVRTGLSEGCAVLSVSDTGIGIPREHQSRIFERFYRVDKSRSKESGGTGLGLSIVKHIVEQHQGAISLESVPDAGTTITVRLPIKTRRAPA